MADQNPFQSMLNPNSGRMGLYDMRMMQSANRMEAPFERGIRAPRSQAVTRAMGGMSDEPDYSSFTYDPTMHARALAAGVTPLEANQVKQNVLLPNTGFFGNHPTLSRALEGGIFGALASHGGQTAGESIQGALEGLVGGQQARQNLYRKQFAGPFQSANAMENLEDRAALSKERDETATLRHTQMEYDMAKMNELKNAPPPRYELPINREVSSFQVWNPDTHKYEQQANPYFDPRTAAAPKVSWGGTEHLREYLEPMGVKDPDQATPAQWAKARQQEQADKRASSAAGVQKPPQTMGLDPKTNQYVAIRPGVSGDVKPLSALESGAHAAESMKAKWMQSHTDKLSAARRALGNAWKPEFATDSAARAKALSDTYDRLGLGGADTDYVYDSGGNLVPTKPQ
jgi:hypothetical protein